MSSPFSISDIKYLKSLKQNIFKIPSGEITNYPYLEYIGSLNKKIILSTGMSNSKEISNAINDFEKKWLNFKSIKMGKHHQNLLNNLEELRKSAGLTQQDLSESAEVSRKSINAIENGIYVPSTVLALKIAKTLKCNVEDIFKLP